MENRNKSGYALGDVFDAHVWTAWKLVPWLSISSRIHYSERDSIDGAYPNAMVMSPSDDPDNYGGEFVILGLGANVALKKGPLAGVRLGIEWEELLDEKYHGIQLGKSDKLNFTISYSFD